MAFAITARPLRQFICNDADTFALDWPRPSEPDALAVRL